MVLMPGIGSTWMVLKGLFILMGLHPISMGTLSCGPVGIGAMGRLRGPGVVMRLTLAGVRIRLSAGAGARSHFKRTSRITPRRFLARLDWRIGYVAAGQWELEQWDGCRVPVS